MPMKFFECPSGHVFEHYIPAQIGKKIYTEKELLLEATKKPIKIKCKISKCNRFAKPTFLSTRQQRMARGFSPSLLYINNEGHVINPGRNDPSHLPSKYLKSLAKQGYKETLINNFRDYEAFQKSQREKLSHHRQLHLDQEQSRYNQELSKNIESLQNGGMVELPDKNGKLRMVKIPPLKDMHPTARRFAEHAIEQARSYKPNAEHSNPMIASLEYDNQIPGTDVHSQYYRDKDTQNHRRH